jgi:hypothetical protein
MSQLSRRSCHAQEYADLVNEARDRYQKAHG